MTRGPRAGYRSTPARPAAREVRMVQLPKAAVRLGALAGTDVVHRFVPDGWTGTSCLVCFGWCTDPRHNGLASLATPAVTP